MDLSYLDPCQLWVPLTWQVTSFLAHRPLLTPSVPVSLSSLSPSSVGTSAASLPCPISSSIAACSVSIARTPRPPILSIIPASAAARCLSVRANAPSVAHTSSAAMSNVGWEDRGPEVPAPASKSQYRMTVKLMTAKRKRIVQWTKHRTCRSDERRPNASPGRHEGQAQGQRLRSQYRRCHRIQSI